MWSPLHTATQHTHTQIPTVFFLHSCTMCLTDTEHTHKQHTHKVSGRGIHTWYAIANSKRWSPQHTHTQQTHTYTHGLFYTGNHLGPHTDTHTHTHTHIHRNFSDMDSGRGICTWTCPSKLTNVVPQHTCTQQRHTITHGLYHTSIHMSLTQI